MNYNILIDDIHIFEWLIRYNSNTLYMLSKSYSESIDRLKFYYRVKENIRITPYRQARLLEVLDILTKAD